MKITVLGSGSSVPHRLRSSSGYLVNASSGTILLDCSPSAVHRMAQEGVDWAELDAIWISHFHLDHCGGLAPLLFSLKHAPQTRSRSRPLTIFGPIGLERLIGSFDQANNYGLLDQRFETSIVEAEPLNDFEILDGVEAVAVKTPHTPESCAIHIRDQTATLVFTSDTGFDPALATLAKGVGLFILECSFVRNKPVEKHLELAEAMHLIRKAQPRLAMLTHFYPEWDDVGFLIETARFESPCEVIEAVDGLTLTIS